VLDAAKALGRLGGNRALYRQLLKRFQQTHASAAEELARALDDSEFPSAANLVHILVSAAGNIGATRLQYAAQGLESALRQAQASRVLATRPRFYAEWQSSLQAVNAALERYRETSQPPVVHDSMSLALENLEQLRRLINEHDTAAVELVDRLRETFVADAETEQALQKLAHSVTSYDFDAAQLHLTEVSSSLTWQSQNQTGDQVFAPISPDRE
jgi:polar amino acid transport system substrate-binding protein